MKVIIVGMGRMGLGLARSLVKKGSQVIAIDSDPAVLKKIVDIPVRKVTGIGFDRTVLEEAKIGAVDAVVACTSSDEANIVIAKVAKDIYHVPRVIARLYDYNKEETYRRIGIQVISATTWGTKRAIEMLTYHHLDNVLEIGNGNVDLVRVDLPLMFVGHTVAKLTSLGEIQVVSISREGKTFIPTAGTVLEANDILYIALITSASLKLKSMLGLA